VLDTRMSSVHQADHAEEVAPDVAAIVIRAGALGFSPTRVAIALGVSPRSLGSIDLAAAPGRRRAGHD
jgi:hypothetical protein